MGTRGLIGLRLHNERYGAYNHWNSFPEMLGVEVVRFILSLNPEDLVTMIERANNVEWVSEECGKLAGADFFPGVLTGHVTEIHNEIAFLTDRLFCEWAYIVDFENQILETYANGDDLLQEITFEELRQVDPSTWAEQVVELRDGPYASP